MSPEDRAASFSFVGDNGTHRLGCSCFACDQNRKSVAIVIRIVVAECVDIVESFIKNPDGTEHRDARDLRAIISEICARAKS